MIKKALPGELSNINLLSADIIKMYENLNLKVPMRNASEKVVVPC